MWRILLISCLAVASCADLTTIHEWKYVDYDFPNGDIRNNYTQSGKYIRENNMPLGLEKFEDRIFITVPRWKKGVVSNLNYIPANSTASSPLLIPYPNLHMNELDTPDGIVSIFRTRKDSCGRLWGVDTGVDDILGDLTVVRPVRLFVFDLKTDKIIRIYYLKDSDQKPDSFFADLVVDVNTCDDTYVYLSDLGGYGLVVYDWNKNTSWRVNHNYFYFDPLNGDYNVSGFNFQWTDGVFGLALSPPHEDGSRILYFHAMSGIIEYSVNTSVLKTNMGSRGHNYYDFHVEGNKGPLTQGPSSVMDQKTLIEYFTQVNRNGIACWDTTVKLTPETFILAEQNNETLVFPNDLTIDEQNNRLLVLSDNLPRLQYSSYDLSKTNFYLTAMDLDSLTERCKAKSNM